MPKGPALRALIVASLPLVLTACGDASGTGPVPASIDILEPDVTFTTAVQQSAISLTVRDVDGRPITNPSLTFTSAQPAVASVDPAGTITGLSNGATTVTVRAGTASAVVNVVVDVVPVALTLGTPVTLAGPIASVRYFTVAVPAGSSDRLLQVRLLGTGGDADLKTRFGTRVDATFDCSSSSLLTNIGNIELCAARDPSQGVWHVAVEGFGDYSGVALLASIEPVTRLQDGVDEPNIGAERFEIRYFDIVVPSGTLSLGTSGGTGDADMFGTPDAIFALPDITEGPCASFNANSTESCSVSSSGTWTVLLFGFTTFSGVTLSGQISP